MRIIILTQDEPFFLAKNIDYLIKNLPEGTEIVSTILFDVSPFGKKESFYRKMKKTWTIFGSYFFLYYTIKYIKSTFNKQKRVSYVLSKHGIKEIRLKQGVNHHRSLEIIRSYRPDLLISIAGNQIFKKKLINLAPLGCLNLHTALLPKYRGLMPSFWVLKNNEPKTGVSIFFVDEGIDSGPILIQKELKIDDHMTQEELIKLSKKLGMNAILESISLIKKGKYQLIENPDSQKTYYTFPTREDVKEFKSKGKRFY
ncbi:methionyl-tRNA formyltransferase [Galbibacter pacificus]|uniref:Formyltransferase family protein n=1 Tax=Galbibacter pacificus TaxID=2996052 RepID=A0ABT6FNN3_9FLAO|nr:formyltransferase family protein [Galbibacter pacificus]MDG3581304.1 formyltransferase family protein [Galbibacter pacificus]MDG3584782.1 formyltransferase family protein [Galbibacter pacificus]